MKGKIHSLESFGSVDGPSVRFVIFVSGCHMRCQFCHNPDTWDIRGGTEYTPQELIQQALKYKAYWGKEGGITVSGGEPLLQIDFLLELVKEAKKHGIHVAIDTSGSPFTRKEPFFSKFQELLNDTDLFLLDIKHIDKEQHILLTGQSNENSIDLAQYLSEVQKPVWIRHVLIPERTDRDDYLQKLSSFIQTLDNVQRIEVLPYHTMGIYKWESLNRPYPLEGIEPPSRERLEYAKRILGAK